MLVLATILVMEATLAPQRPFYVAVSTVSRKAGILSKVDSPKIQVKSELTSGTIVAVRQAST